MSHDAPGGLSPADLYDLVHDAARQALRDELGGDDVPLAKRMVEGRVVFIDGDERTVKETPAAAFFSKVTAVRERLRVLEQKINNHDGLSNTDKAELQSYITRSYGSLTTFNFLFREEADKFVGTGGK